MSEVNKETQSCKQVWQNVEGLSAETDLATKHGFGGWRRPGLPSSGPAAIKGCH